MDSNIIIPDCKRLEETKTALSRQGAEKIHILADFDRTLTKAFVSGESVPSLISILRDGNYLTPDYAVKANALYEEYHPIEIDLTIPLEEKKKAMQEWWMAHFDLLIKSGLNKKDLERIAKSRKVELRSGCEEFLDLLHKYDIPVVIISSSGLGGDVISMYLEKKRKLYNNIYIISNSFRWGKDGKVVAVKEPIIHAMNKDGTAIRDFPVFNIVKDRKNVLLLGDSLADVGMVKGFDYENLLKIGFLNEKIKENLEDYKMNYDVLILNDSSMGYLNTLLQEIIIKK